MPINLSYNREHEANAIFANTAPGIMKMQTSGGEIEAPCLEAFYQMFKVACGARAKNQFFNPQNPNSGPAQFGAAQSMHEIITKAWTSGGHQADIQMTFGATGSQPLEGEKYFDQNQGWITRDYSGTFNKNSGGLMLNLAMMKFSQDPELYLQVMNSCKNNVNDINFFEDCGDRDHFWGCDTNTHPQIGANFQGLIMREAFRELQKLEVRSADGATLLGFRDPLSAPGSPPLFGGIKTLSANIPNPDIAINPQYNTLQKFGRFVGQPPKAMTIRPISHALIVEMNASLSQLAANPAIKDLAKAKRPEIEFATSTLGAVALPRLQPRVGGGVPAPKSTGMTAPSTFRKATEEEIKAEEVAIRGRVIKRDSDYTKTTGNSQVVKVFLPSITTPEKAQFQHTIFLANGDNGPTLAGNEYFITISAKGSAENKAGAASLVDFKKLMDKQFLPLADYIKAGGHLAYTYIFDDIFPNYKDLDSARKKYFEDKIEELAIAKNSAVIDGAGFDKAKNVLQAQVTESAATDVARANPAASEAIPNLLDPDYDVIISQKSLQSAFAEMVKDAGSKTESLTYHPNKVAPPEKYAPVYNPDPAKPAAEITQDIVISKAAPVDVARQQKILRSRSALNTAVKFEKVTLFGAASVSNASDFVVDVNFGNRQNYGGFAIHGGPHAQEETKALASKASLALAYLHQKGDIDLKLGEHDIFADAAKTTLSPGTPLLIQGATFKSGGKDVEIAELAMAAPKLDGGKDRPGTNCIESAKYLFLTAYNGFELCKKVANEQGKQNVKVRSGLWGAGAFANDPFLSLAMQSAAAAQAGVNITFSNSFGKDVVDEFEKDYLPEIININARGDVSSEDKISQIFNLCQSKTKDKAGYSAPVAIAAPLPFDINTLLTNIIDKSHTSSDGSTRGVMQYFSDATSVIVDPAGTAFPGLGKMEGGGGSGALYDKIYESGKNAEFPYGRPISDRDLALLINTGPGFSLLPSQAIYNNTLAAQKINVIHAIGPRYVVSQFPTPTPAALTAAKAKFARDLTITLKNTLKVWQESPNAELDLKLPLLSGGIYKGTLGLEDYSEILLDSLKNAIAASVTDGVLDVAKASKIMVVAGDKLEFQCLENARDKSLGKSKSPHVISEAAVDALKAKQDLQAQNEGLMMASKLDADNKQLFRFFAIVGRNKEGADGFAYNDIAKAYDAERSDNAAKDKSSLMETQESDVKKGKYIDYLFPLPKINYKDGSKNKTAHDLEYTLEKDSALYPMLIDNPVFRRNFQDSFNMMMDFYDLKIDEKTGKFFSTEREEKPNHYQSNAPAIVHIMKSSMHLFEDRALVGDMEALAIIKRAEALGNFLLEQKTWLVLPANKDISKNIAKTTIYLSCISRSAAEMMKLDDVPPSEGKDVNAEAVRAAKDKAAKDKADADAAAAAKAKAAKDKADAEAKAAKDKAAADAAIDNAITLTQDTLEGSDPDAKDKLVLDLAMIVFNRQRSSYEESFKNEKGEKGEKVVGKNVSPLSFGKTNLIREYIRDVAKKKLGIAAKDPLAIDKSSKLGSDYDVTIDAAKIRFETVIDSKDENKIKTRMYCGIQQGFLPPPGLQYASFGGLKLEGAIFAGAEISFLNFNSCDVSGLDLSGIGDDAGRLAMFATLKFHNCVGLDKMILPAGAVFKDSAITFSDAKPAAKDTPAVAVAAAGPLPEGAIKKKADIVQSLKDKRLLETGEPKIETHRLEGVESSFERLRDPSTSPSGASAAALATAATRTV